MTTTANPERHAHRRLRQEVVLRTLDVLRVERLTPHMQRVTLGAAELSGFHSAAPDATTAITSEAPNKVGS